MEAGALLGCCPGGVRRKHVMAPPTSRCKQCETDDARRRRVLWPVTLSSASRPDASFCEKPTGGASGDHNDDEDWVLLSPEMLIVGTEDEEALRPSAPQGWTVVRGGKIRAWLRLNVPWRPDKKGAY